LGRPQDAAGAAEAVRGSAVDAPGVGSGPVGERFPEAARLGSAIEADGRAVHRSLMGGLPVFGDDDPVLRDMREAFADPRNAEAVAQLRRELGAAPAGIEVEPGAGAVEPQVMSREGAFGARTERRSLPTVETLISRRAALAADVAGIAITGAKLARHMPTTDDEMDEFRAAGFDLVVISRQAGFRRAGVAHPTAPTLRRSQDFEVNEIEAMARDPMLVVQALR
ncbi:HI1506-related protein, partial [Methylobacterium sp. WL6]|uniref:HI1506-related protein n=1 Tax=Methylobacterium sp. WL6 TaxID=2603901 RepID=UPI00164F59DC